MGLKDPQEKSQWFRCDKLFLFSCLIIKATSRQDPSADVKAELHLCLVFLKLNWLIQF